MIEIRVRDNEPIDNTLKRLKSRLFTEGTMEEVYRRRTFENSQLKRKRKLRSLHKKSKYL